MIYTLTTNLSLYDLHRNKAGIQLAMAKRKAFWLICGIISCLTISTYFFVIYL